jgi:hypothetical protein
MGKKFPNNHSDGLEFYTCYGGNVRCNNEEYEPPVVITMKNWFNRKTTVHETNFIYLNQVIQGFKNPR